MLSKPIAAAMASHDTRTLAIDGRKIAIHVDGVLCHRDVTQKRLEGALGDTTPQLPAQHLAKRNDEQSLPWNSSMRFE